MSNYFESLPGSVLRVDRSWRSRLLWALDTYAKCNATKMFVINLWKEKTVCLEKKYSAKSPCEKNAVTRKNPVWSQVISKELLL